MDTKCKLKIFDNNLITIRKCTVTLKLNKPAYVGISILDLSKVFLDESYYYQIKIKNSKNSKLLFTGTGSLMYEIKSEDVHENFSKNKEMFGFSNYSTNSKYYDS